MPGFYPTDPRQRTLIERYLLSVSAYMVSVSAAWTAKGAGLTTLSYRSLSISTLLIVVYVIAIYLIYRTGLNRRLQDSTFTQLQMLVAIAWVSYFITSTQELRGVSLSIYLFIVMFSFFSLSHLQTGLIALVIALAYGLIIIADWHWQSAGFNPTVNLIQWSILAAVLLWFWGISRYASLTRRKIRDSSEKIQAQNREIQSTNHKLELALTRLEELATTDELTGLSNRRHFMSTVRSHIDRCENDQLTFGLCVLDLDRFKSINDRWGHQVGDRVLVSLAEVLRQNMREYDFLARLGGEEFVLIVTRGNEEITRQCAERLRRAAENADLGTLAAGLRMTVTIGATVFRGGDTLESALGRADRAMYAGKDAGRNRCRFDTCDSLSRPDSAV